MARWTATPVALLLGGEALDPAPGVRGARLRMLRNAVLRGAGRIEQQPDFRETAVCKNGTPVEVHAVCGIFPFTKQGGATAATAAIVFSHDADADDILLHQVAEDRTILRTLTAWGSYGEALPPQITGFEMYGKFYFCEYARESVATRQGLTVFDPTGAGSVTVPTYAIVAGGAAAAALRFRGIARHRGATILGWGYQSEETGSIDQPQCVRYCRYNEPDTWVPDTTDVSAGYFNLGTLGLPVVAAARSGLYTILAKESEIFALDGDFSVNFYYRQIGEAHGPASTVGMVSIGEAAVWLSGIGPIISENGGPIQPIAIDRIVRRFLNYSDLSTAWGAYDATRHRVIWGLRRQRDENDVAETSPYLTELLIWDHLRNEFYVSGVPGQIFCVGSLRGAGITLVGPTGVVSNIAASSITASTAVITWTAGDTNPDVTFQVQYRENGSTTWISAGAPVGTTTQSLTRLLASTHYDVRVAQIRNGQYSAYVQSLDLFTTAAAASVPAPTGVTATEIGAGGLVSTVRAGWTPFTAPNTEVAIYEGSTAVFAEAMRVGAAAPGAGEFESGNLYGVGTDVYVWARTEATDGTGAVSAAVAATPSPLTIVGL